MLTALASDPPWVAARMHEPRWFHGLDKAFGGYGVGAPGGHADIFARWVTDVRFTLVVVEARVSVWQRQALDACHLGREERNRGDVVAATLALREGARALRLVLIEGWGERLGSMGREWTRFERIAARHGASDVAARIAALAGADPVAIGDVVAHTPLWLRERIDLAYAGRCAVGEEVSAAENARDQIAAFRGPRTAPPPGPERQLAGAPGPRSRRQARRAWRTSRYVLSIITPSLRSTRGTSAIGIFIACRRGYSPYPRGDQ